MRVAKRFLWKYNFQLIRMINLFVAIVGRIERVCAAIAAELYVINFAKSNFICSHLAAIIVTLNNLPLDSILIEIMWRLWWLNGHSTASHFSCDRSAARANEYVHKCRRYKLLQLIAAHVRAMRDCVSSGQTNTDRFNLCNLSAFDFDFNTNLFRSRLCMHPTISERLCRSAREMMMREKLLQMKSWNGGNSFSFDVRVCWSEGVRVCVWTVKMTNLLPQTTNHCFPASETELKKRYSQYPVSMPRDIHIAAYHFRVLERVMYDSDSLITLKQRFTPSRLLDTEWTAAPAAPPTPNYIDTRIREPGSNMINKRPPIERINSLDLLIFLAAQRQSVAMHRFFHFMHRPIDLCHFAKQKFN